MKYKQVTKYLPSSVVLNSYCKSYDFKQENIYFWGGGIFSLYFSFLAKTRLTDSPNLCHLPWILTVPSPCSTSLTPFPIFLGTTATLCSEYNLDGCKEHNLLEITQWDTREEVSIKVRGHRKESFKWHLNHDCHLTSLPLTYSTAKYILSPIPNQQVIKKAIGQIKSLWTYREEFQAQFKTAFPASEIKENTCKRTWEKLIVIIFKFDCGDLAGVSLPAATGSLSPGFLANTSSHSVHLTQWTWSSPCENSQGQHQPR